MILLRGDAGWSYVHGPAGLDRPVFGAGLLLKLHVNIRFTVVFYGCFFRLFLG